jgi:Ca2+-binding RTX toxin-like protein
MDDLYFDEAFYLRAYPDVAQNWSGSALDHYRIYGIHEGRDPNAGFSEAAYLNLYPDVAAAVAAGQFANGYAHFLDFGRTEGRSPDGRYAGDAIYLASQPDVAAAVTAGAFASGLQHYFLYGATEGRDPIRNDIVGTPGNDLLEGTMTPAANRVFGLEGNDQLFGGSDITTRGTNISGDDLLYGGPGDDLLDGGAGADRLNGGTGADHFRFDSQYNYSLSGPFFFADVVEDFSVAEGDVIDLRTLGLSFATLRASDTAEGLLLDLSGSTTGASGTILLPTHMVVEMQADWFLF